jgi:hypothetical protein
VVATVSTVECVICKKTHIETPPVREDGQHHAKDWGYYRDNFRTFGYAVICKRVHDDIVAPKPMKQES